MNRKYYAMVNRGDDNGYKCFRFDSLKDMRVFCESYHWHRINHKEATKQKDRKHVTVSGSGIDTYFQFS